MPTFITESRPELWDIKGQCFFKAIKPKVVKTEKKKKCSFILSVSCILSD